MTAARCLRDALVVLINRTNHHVFQPLLYQRMVLEFEEAERQRAETGRRIASPS